MGSTLSTLSTSKPRYYNEATGLAVLKLAICAKLPISNSYAAADATKAILKANIYPDESKIWNKKAIDTKTWENWKVNFKDARSNANSSSRPWEAKINSVPSMLPCHEQ